ncbi:MAG: DUF4349 domain-containing protein [Lachnospiraceae bacterium]|nr:DUF4349 domain-containing protein [Lachnospiraceae bacterium]
MIRKKLVVGLITASIAVQALVGCGASDKSSSSADMNSLATTGAVSYAASDGKYVTSEAMVEESYNPTMDTSGATGGNTTTVSVSTSQKLIVNKTMSVKTEAFDEVLSQLKAQVRAKGGYIETSDITGTGEERDLRRATLVIRMPQGSLDEVVDSLSEATTVVSSSENAQDVTMEYVDLDAHIEALRAEQTALMGMLEKATSLSDIITLQSELTDLRYQIESFESRLRTLDNLVSYSTLTLTMREIRSDVVEEEPGYWETIFSGVGESFQTLGYEMAEIFSFLIINLPYLLFWGVIGYFIVRAIHNAYLKKQGIDPKEWRKKKSKKED